MKPIRYACFGFVALQLAVNPAASPTVWADDPLNQADPLNQPEPPGKRPVPVARSGEERTASSPDTTSPPMSSPSGLSSILGQDLPAAGWIGAAQDLRVAAETAERVADLLAEVMQSAFFHFAEASRHFDPLGLKANAETIARQHDTIARQGDIIQELLQTEIKRLEAENAKLRRAARQNDVIGDSLRAKTNPLEAADELTEQAADAVDSNR